MRQMTSLWFVVLAALGSVALSGCVVERVPPPRYEVVAVAPGPGLVWERGHWIRYGHEWRWVGGHWRR